MKKILAALWLAVTLNSVWAGDYQEGVAAFLKKNYPVALAKFKAESAKGNAVAQYYLALMYQQGEGVEQNPAEAIRLYKQSAENGFRGAQYNLALIYQRGVDTVQNQAEAARLYKLAAAQGLAGAANNLATQYEHGEGVPQDYVQAARLYSHFLIIVTVFAVLLFNYSPRFLIAGNPDQKSVLGENDFSIS